MYILAADFGTSSIKAGVYTEDLTEVCTAKASYDYQVSGLQAQIDAGVMYEGFLKCLRAMGEWLRKIDIVAIDNFSPSVIAMDREGEALYPCIIHLDRRSYPQSRYALKCLPKETFLKINGNLPFAGGISLTSILWLMQNEPETAAKTFCYGHLNTYVLKKLTGRFLIDPANASFTGLYETFSGKGWSPELTGALGIDAKKLPQIQHSLTLAGKITAKAAKETGLPEGLPVLMGANDSASAAYGAGAVHSGDIMNISGSSEIMTVTTDHPVPNPKFYCRTSVEADKWLYLCITVGGFAMEWFRRVFCQDMDKDTFYGKYIAEVTSSQETGDVRFLPHLSGDRHSLVKKKGSFSGLTMDTTREEMLRALVKGTFDPMTTSLKIIGKTTPLNKQVFLTGGVVSPAYQHFKELAFEGYSFSMRSNCSLLGATKAAIRTLNEQR